MFHVNNIIIMGNIYAVIIGTNYDSYETKVTNEGMEIML